MSKRISSVVLASAVALAVSSTAQTASAHDQRRQHGGYSQGHPGYQQSHHGYSSGHRGYSQGEYRSNAPTVYYQVPVYGHSYGQQYGQSYGYGTQQHNWQRGGYLPQAYRSQAYYVPNYQHHRLYAPPRGHGWYRADSGNYVLAALATGLIIGVIAAQ